MTNSTTTAPAQTNKPAVQNGMSALDYGHVVPTARLHSASGTGGLQTAETNVGAYTLASVGPAGGHPNPPQLPTYTARS